MLIFLQAGLAFLATPKTGTTAIENALRPKADLVFQRRRKHMPPRRFNKKVVPFVANTFGQKLESVAVMREPLEQLRSWYSYRARADMTGLPKSTQDVSFAQFVAAVISEDPPIYAQVGSQQNFLCKDGVLAVDHLFAYDNMPGFIDFMQTRLGSEIALKRKNVSPEIEAVLTEEDITRFRRARSEEYALFERLAAAGGYLDNR